MSDGVVRKVLVVPSRINGSVSRVVSDGENGWVETWTGSEWKRDDNQTIRNVIVAPPASEELLRAIGATP